MATMAGTRSAWEVERLTPAAGVGAVLCWIIGVIVAGDIDSKDKGVELLAYYLAHDAKLIVGGIVWMIGCALFVWFLGGLRARLLAAEGPEGRLTSVAFGGGLAAAICLALDAGPDMAGAFSNEDLDASAARALHSVTDAFFIAAEYLTPVLLVATGLIVLRTAVFPRWFAWLSLLIAVVMLIAPIGWAAVVFAFPIWVLIATYLLWRPANSGNAAFGQTGPG